VEAALIKRYLTDPQAELRREVVQFLVSDEGQEVWLATESERRFHDALRRRASSELLALLDAVQAYETFSRLLEDAFVDCLHAMTQSGTKTGLADLARCDAVVKAAREAPELFPRVAEVLLPYGESVRFQQDFVPLADPSSPAAWVEQLLQHHRKVQLRKPPNGKTPWVERFDDGSVAVRPQYRRNQSGALDDSYVHQYRTWPLESFARDLRMV
jgi:hypothetical protein